jgi:hypothetical protein
MGVVSMSSSRVSVSRLGFVEGGPAYVVVAAFVFLDERHIGHNDWRGFICGACWGERERERGRGGGLIRLHHLGLGWMWLSGMN